MPITEEHKKAAEKSLFSIFGLKGLTPHEKNKLFAEAVAKRRSESAANPEKFKPTAMSKEQKQQKAQYGTSFKSYAEKKAAQEAVAKSARKKPTLFEGTEPSSENISTRTPEQEQYTKDLLKLLQGKWEPLLKEMSQSPRTPMNQQIEDWFSHMNNPIVQNMIGQGYRTNPQVLYPSELGQHDSNRQLDALLSGLGQQYGPAALEYGYNKASEYLPQAYDYAKGIPGQVGGGFMDMLSGLANKFRSPQQP